MSARASEISDRVYSFLIPAFMEGMACLIQVALPMVAIRLGAGAWFLGMLGWVPHALRLPFSLFSGGLSDRFGRTRIMLPSVIVAMLACVGLALARSTTQLLVAFVVLVACSGAFYTTFQAFIGDRSSAAGLRQNLSSFNLGWSIGGSLLALSAGYLLQAGAKVPFVIGAVLMFVVMSLLVVWVRAKTAGSSVAETATDEQAGTDYRMLLFLSRLGNFVGFFGLAMMFNLFAKLGTELGMSEGRIGLIVGMAIVGQAVGMLAVGAGPWWRGRLWPQVSAQVLMLLASVTIVLSSIWLVIATAFLVHGFSLGVTYTGSQYYGIRSGAFKGKSMGIHFSLVSLGLVLGSLIGGAVAETVSLRAPFFIAACLAVTGLVASLARAAYELRKPSSLLSPEDTEQLT